MSWLSRWIGKIALAAVWVAWASRAALAQPALQAPPPAPYTGPTMVVPTEAAPGAVHAGPVIIHPAGYTEPSDGPSPDNPTARQEPAVSLEWVGPSVVKLGQPASYQIMVKNISSHPVQQVTIRVPVPASTTVSATEPKAASQGKDLVWELGTLEPRQEKRLDVQTVPGVTGALAMQAFVTISGCSTMHLQVREPKVAVQTVAPEKVIVGDPATVALTVSNPGDATAEFVKVIAHLSDGLEHARGNSIQFDLGNLAPKETRTVHVLCAAKSEGPQTCTAEVIGEPKLTASETAKIEVLMPKVDLTVTGPGMRYLDRHANLVFKVANPGTATACQVTLIDQVPQGFSFVSASADGRHDFVSRTVTWFLGDIPPGQSREVTLDLTAANTGEHKNKASVTAARGLHAEGEVGTRVEGLPALLMELVDLDDPLEVGAETSYEIRITNTGTKTETNLQLTCTVPDKMEYRSARAPEGVNVKEEGKEIVFDPLPKLAPRADVIYRVKVRGQAPGDVRFRARIKADGLTEPVLKEESTKVYGDDTGSH